MKMHQISYFLAVCDEKSFTRAAQRCGVKQPSITVAIRRLEDEIGGPLFERSNSAVRLTNLGHLVRPDFALINRYAAAVKGKAAKYIAAHSTANKPKARETNMRVIAVTAATLALFLMGLALRPTPSATGAPTEQANAQTEPYALQATTGGRSLVELNTDELI